MPFKPVPIEINPRTVSYFWRRVDKSPHPKGCWMWEGSKAGTHKDKYGRMGYGKTRPGAHRFSWVLHNGPVPDDMEILHKCDNTLCVNPDHLYVGTHHRNMLDRKARGRGNHPTGERHPKAKLTVEQVEEIRKLGSKGYSNRELGKMFGVSNTAVFHIKKGNHWRDRAMSAPRRDAAD
jgi:hypothetical protein